MDGSFMDTSGKAGGGLVRDHAGNLLVAFATPVEAQSALEAELLAIHHGIILAMEFRRPNWIEVDADQAVKLLNGPSWGPASLCRVMARIATHKRQQVTRMTFIHREGNKAADWLAKMGLEGTSFQRMYTSTAPRLLKALVRLDARGVPHIRIQTEEEE
ncbi:uncharacterized protein LOC121804029 [Salvia splendens]|uniref:uncharacterized protein LOC121804029 n=1 Tax=Salvia splendens TaxID=180675 RepID=UPI001C26A3A5|nr:uncharacterized protein LOC121804029 [Salvia splendens]